MSVIEISVYEVRGKDTKTSDKPKIHINFWDYKPKIHIDFWNLNPCPVGPSQGSRGQS
jgi:hypothetical protein